MRLFILLWLLSLRTGFGLPITGPELINPSIVEINRCVPETMREPIHVAIMRLPKVGKVVAKLYKEVKGKFAKNCNVFARKLEELDNERLLAYKNVAPNFNKKDRQAIYAILSDPDNGFDNYLYILRNLDLHLAGYVGILHRMLNRGARLTLIDLIHTVDLIQRGALELQEFIQLASYLSLAYEEIEGYHLLLSRLQHQLSFKIIYMINTICTLTEDLRVAYVSLVDKGDCSGEQISHALGVTKKKNDAINAE